MRAKSTRSRSRGKGRPAPGEMDPASEDPTQEGVLAPRGTFRGGQRHSRRRGSQGRRWPPARRPKVVENPREEEATLFQMVTLGRDSIQAAVEDWVQAYKVNRDMALLDLMGFFIQSCGCEGLVTAELYQSGQERGICHKMTEKFDPVTGLYYKRLLVPPWILTITWPAEMENDFCPLLGPGPCWRRFRANFCQFMELLVHHTASGILFQGHLTETLVSMLSGLSSSGERSLRHTSTLAALKLLTALARVNQELCVHQHREETAPCGWCQRYRQLLEERRSELQRKLLAIDRVICSLFRRTFVPRYRDLSADIRVLCVEELGTWVSRYPDMFLSDEYLKYIGWMLYDKDAEVRLKCVMALQTLSEKKESALKLSLFFHKFKERLLSMTQDVQPDVTAASMRLLKLLSEHHAGIFSSAEYVFLFQFVYAAYRPMAVAAGELIYRRLLASPQDSLLSRGHEEEFDRNAHYLQTLIGFYLQGKFHRHVTYLVDGLWEWAPGLLCDWETMVALLLHEAPPEHRGLSAEQEGVLLEILVAAVRQAAEHRPPAGRLLGKRASREKRDDCRVISQHLLVALPRLLAKFAGDPEKVAALLQIPRFCTLDVLAAEGFSPHLDAILQELDRLVQRHSDLEVLEACAQAYSHFCDEELAIHCRTAPALSRLVNTLVDILTPLLDLFLCQENRSLLVGRAETLRICSILRKLAAFYNAHDLSSWRLYDKMAGLLTFQRRQGGPPVEVVHCALQCTYYSLLWEIAAATDKLPPRESLLQLRRRLMRFCLACRTYLSHHSQVLREKAFILLCDLLLILSHQGLGGGALGLLFFVPDHVLQARLLKFLREHVFLEREAEATGLRRVYKEEEAQALFWRRNMLAVFCKLLVCNVLGLGAAAEVYQFYLQYYHTFGDIIKETMTRTRQNDKLRYASSLLLCLQQLYRKHVDAHGVCYDPVRLICGPFHDVRHLAQRLALTLGFDLLRARDAAHLIHRRGLTFAFAEAPGRKPSGPRFPNLSFLLLLSEFSAKVLPADRPALLVHFQDKVPAGIPPFQEGEMNPLLVYRKSLIREDEALALEGPEELPPNPFEVMAQESRRLQGLADDQCSPWAPDAVVDASIEGSRGSQQPQRDMFTVDLLSSEESSSEDTDVEPSTDQFLLD